MDQQTQQEYFARAVQLIGGQQATSRALNMSDRSVRMLLSGDRRLHAGILEDMAKALIAHADECRALERKLSPAFASNRTEAQARPPLHTGKMPIKLSTRMLRTLDTARANNRIPSGWTISQTCYSRLAEDRIFDRRGTWPETLFDLPFDIAKDDDVNSAGYILHVQER
jgi:hypothetical protein